MIQTQVVGQSPPTNASDEQANQTEQAVEQIPRQKPTKSLPTDRIAFGKQLDLLRAYAVVSGPELKPVNHTDVSSLMKMNAATLSLASPFFADIGLMQKMEGGKYALNQAVYEYRRAFEWNPETAANKLAPIMTNSWFGKALLPRLQFAKVLSEKDAIELLATEANAVPYYARHLSMLLDYLLATGLIKREGGNISILQGATTKAAEPVTEVQPDMQRSGAGKVDSPAPATTSTVATGFLQDAEGKVQFNVSVRVDMAEFATWKADRIGAFFNGIAQVLAAKANVEKRAGS